jgi:hypothetical protein
MLDVCVLSLTAAEMGLTALKLEKTATKPAF